MPAFCDPGTDFIAHCHALGIKVTATYFPQSMVLAWALAGFPGPFYFAGMLPGKTAGERRASLAGLLQRPEAVIFYDTPYRLAALGKDLQSLKNQRQLFLACDLNSPQEELFWGKACAAAFASAQKREYVVVVAPRGYKVPSLKKGGRGA
jgi:16S rRNA (cytidine1402-2'-O)-methyltransferase